MPVEGVEELGPELQLHRFANREVLDRGELRNGLMVWDLNGISREPWQNRTQSYSDPRWDATLPAPLNVNYPRAFRGARTPRCD
jgi:hypothetical protein